MWRDSSVSLLRQLRFEILESRELLAASSGILPEQESGQLSIAQPVMEKLTGGEILHESLRLSLNHAERIPPGKIVRFDVASSNESKSFEYRFLLKTQGIWQQVREYQADPYWTWDTSNLASGQYHLQVQARSQGSTAHWDLLSNVLHPLLTDVPSTTGVSLQASPTLHVPQYGHILFAAQGIGGSGEYEYQFMLKTGATWLETQGYSSNPTWDWLPADAPLDQYHVFVRARSVGSHASWDSLSNVVHIDVVDPPPAAVLTITTDSPDRIFPGATVRYIASAHGGSGEFEYRYLVKTDGVWQETRSYGPNRQWDWNTQDAAEQQYHVQVQVRNSGSLARWESLSNVLHPVITETIAAENASLSSLSGSSVRSGETVDLIAAGSGGEQTFEYRFSIRHTEGEWRELRGYTDQPEFSWDSTNEPLGDYFFWVDVRSTGSPAQFEAQRVIRISIRENVEQMWARVLRPYLQDDLWAPRDRYDAAHTMMVPLFAAFATGPDEWRHDFSQHFQRLVDAGGVPDEGEDSRLSRLQYLSVVSKFVALAQNAGQPELISAGLVEMLFEETENFWTRHPAWQWERPPFEGGIKERLQWKLNTLNVSVSYHRAIVDHEMFLISIAADLRSYERTSGMTHQQSGMLDEILVVARQIFDQEVVWSNNGWLLQPGVWTDHPVYQFAGHKELAPDLQPLPVAGIAQDTSHSHRLPVWLIGLAEAYPEGSSSRLFYEQLLTGLETQFMEIVLVPPSDEFAGYRVTNYMDGYNGIYRYQYSTVGDNFGYHPYGLSGTLSEGWWSLLGTERVKDVFHHMAAQFPLPAEQIDVYVGPNTTRERHPLVTDPDSFENGLRELLVVLGG